MHLAQKRWRHGDTTLTFFNVPQHTAHRVSCLMGPNFIFFLPYSNFSFFVFQPRECETRETLSLSPLNASFPLGPPSFSARTASARKNALSFSVGRKERVFRRAWWTGTVCGWTWAHYKKMRHYNYGLWSVTHQLDQSSLHPRGQNQNPPSPERIIHRLDRPTAPHRARSPPSPSVSNI